MPARVAALLVDDDARLGALVTEYLGRHEVDVTVAGDGERGLAALRKGRFDVVLLDVMLPGIDGLEVCRRLRASPGLASLPVVMLTAKGDDVDRIVGLELGADDYLGKPFNPRELLARIRAILRRREPEPAVRRRVAVGDIVIDLEARSAMHAKNGEIALTSAEFDLLECFVTRPQRVLSREQLMDWTRGRRADPLDRTIDVQVSRLRKKIEAGEEPLIKTVRNAGYMLCAPVEER
jgi:two-component system OmpR family response regulator